MRSGFFVISAFLVMFLACPIGSAQASYETGRTSAGFGPATLQFYGTLVPEPGWFQNGHATQWGYGAGLQWYLSGRLALELDAARFAEKETSISPFGVGVVYRSDRDMRVRPWLEGGLGYYRFTEPGLILRGFSSSGNVRDQFTYPPLSSGPVSSDAWGGYFGFGANLRLVHHVALTSGLRVDSWSGGGMAWLKTGLSIRF